MRRLPVELSQLGRRLCVVGTHLRGRPRKKYEKERAHPDKTWDRCLVLKAQKKTGPDFLKEWMSLRRVVLGLRRLNIYPEEALAAQKFAGRLLFTCPFVTDALFSLNHGGLNLAAVHKHGIANCSWKDHNGDTVKGIAWPDCPYPTPWRVEAGAEPRLHFLLCGVARGARVGAVPGAPALRPISLCLDASPAFGLAATLRSGARVRHARCPSAPSARPGRAPSRACGLETAAPAWHQAGAHPSFPIWGRVGRAG